jgi:glyoxylase-like metal-dependent hydrolase (beta-lactamase superfamily II)
MSNQYPAIPLEDFAEDIFNKARKGLGLSVEELAERTGSSVSQINRLFSGDTQPEQDADLIQQLAFVLNLSPKATLASAQKRYTPQPISMINGLEMVTTDYGEMTVNAFAVWDPAEKVAATFDTGSSCKHLLDIGKQHQLSWQRHFITHTHMDHLADLDTLLNTTGAKGYGSAIDNPLRLLPLRHGDGLILGKLKIRVLGTAGHTPSGLSYFIEGLERPVVVTGDALFAGSMGGAPYAYDQALQNNLKYLFTLPNETLICPGHGPMSTVGEQKQMNPFYAHFLTNFYKESEN